MGRESVKEMKKLRIFTDPLRYTFDRDINSTLVEMGHDVVKFNEWNFPNYHPSRREGEKAVERIKTEKSMINKRLIEEVKKAHEKKKIDLFLSVTDTMFTYPETIEKIKKIGIPTLNLAHDAAPKSYFMSLIKDLALVFDYNWTAQPEAIKSYKKIGAEVFYVHYGANPHIYKPYNCERKYDVTFMGRNRSFTYRKKVIQTIVDAGIDIRVWGDGWQPSIPQIKTVILSDLSEMIHGQGKLREKLLQSELVWYIRHFGKVKKIFGPFLSDDEMVKMYSRSKINLNFSGITTQGLHGEDFDKAPRTLKGTDFEAPMSGAFYLTEYLDEIAELYKIGKEIETYRSIPELVDKIKYYLENPDEAEAIRKAGRQRALKDHTLEKVFEKVFNEIGFSL